MCAILPEKHSGTKEQQVRIGLDETKVFGCRIRCDFFITRLISLFVILLAPCFLFAQTKPPSVLQPAVSYELQGAFDTLNLPALQWILEEGKQTLTFEQVQAGALADAKWIDLTASPKFPIKAHTDYLFKIRLTTGEVQPEAFSVIFNRSGNCYPFEPTFKFVETYSVGMDGKATAGYSGSRTPVSRRDYPDLFLPSMIRGKMTASDTLDIWCKVSMAEPCNLQVDLKLIREKIILSPRLVSGRQKAEMLFLGASVALLLIASLLLVWFRTPVYFWFVVFQVAVLLKGFSFFQQQEIFRLFFSEDPKWVIFLILLGSIFQIASLLQFGRIYIGTKQRYPLVHVVFGAAIWLQILTLVAGSTARIWLDIPDFFWFRLRDMATILTLFFILAGSIPLLFSRDRLAQFFCIGAIGPILSSMNRLYEFLIRQMPYERDVMLESSFGMIFTMAMALAYHFRQEIKQKEAALIGKVDAELKNSEQQMRMQLAAEEAQRLSELDKMKSNFFANVTHELRTPLTLILSPLSNLLKSKNIDNTEFTQLKMMEKNAQELLKLTNEILDLTKLESSKLTLDEQPVAFYPYLKTLVSMFETYAQKKGIHLGFEYSAEPQLQISIDQNKFEKIVNNLLANAFKFTQMNGKVIVKLTDNGNYLQLEVIDTGRGIHPEDLELVFNRFYQSKMPHAEEGGTGIGLALVNEYIKLFGGSVRVVSALNEGSTFTVQFPKKQVIKPLEAADALAIKKLKAAVAEVDNGSFTKNDIAINQAQQYQTTILFVEDNIQIQEYIQSLLGMQHTVITADNGQEALDWLQQKLQSGQLPDLILSDVMMPIMDGIQLLSTLKSTDQYSTIPVIMLTAKAELDAKLQALRIGVDDYLTKPFEVDELLARIENLLRNAAARKHYLEGDEIDPETSEATKEDGVYTATTTISQTDLAWLAELEASVLQKLSDADFTLDMLGDIIFVSPRQIRRRLKQLTGLSFSDYLNEARYRQARQMLELKQVDSVKRLAAEVGMRDVKYFSQQFKLRFGKSPSDYLL